MRKGDDLDPKGLIAESYKIEGITAAECRSIFLDWALSLPMDCDSKPLMTALIERHGDEAHPMTEVLRNGLASMDKPKRRGGFRSRPRPE